MGSVKDLTIIKPAYENQPGVGRFRFSDRYSVFDWGEMPDQIEGKGRALATMAAFNFEGLEKDEIKTHYRGLVDSKGRLVRFDELEDGENGADTMEVDLGVVYRPIARHFIENGVPVVKYDYFIFNYDRINSELERPNNYLIPLEIIYRNGLPKGSSVFDNIKKAKNEPDKAKGEEMLEGILKSLGLKEEPKEGDMLPHPIITYTTKLEAGDRKLSHNEALDISGLDSVEFDDVISTAFDVNDFITKQGAKAGLTHYDGKVEMLLRDGRPVVCDVVGTLDEDRFGFNGEQVSKEFLRDWYNRNQPEFRASCKEWEQTGPGWQERCPVKPIKLFAAIPKTTSRMYMSVANRYTQRKIFDAPEMEEAMSDLKTVKEILG